MLNIIAILIFLLVIGLSVNTVWAGENYNSSKSNTATSIGIVNRDVGNLLIGYGYGGEVVNQVTEALAVGVTTDGLRTILGGTSARSPAVVEEVLQKLEAELVRLGIRFQDDKDSTQAVSTPDAGGAVPSPSTGTLKELLPSGISPSKRAEPAPEVKNIELMQNTIGKIQERLKSCDNTDVCDIVERHAKGRKELTDTTKKAIENRNWEEAIRLLHEVRGIVIGDIELLEGAGDKGSIADVLGLERALLNQTDSALKAIATTPQQPSPSEARENVKKEFGGLDSETRSGGFIKLGDLPGKRAAFGDSTTKSIQNLKSAESKEQREDIRKELKYRRVLLQQGVQTLRQDLRANAKDLRDNFRENIKTTIGHVDHGKSGRIGLAHGRGLRMLNRYRSAIARFDHILGRLESRIEKIRIETEGETRAEGNLLKVNNPGTIALIEEAKNTQVLNKAKLVELEAKYESLLEGKNPGGIAEEAREIAKELKSEIEKLHGLLDDIKQAATDFNSSVSNTTNTL